jgi:hypothetical protein
MNKMTPQDSCQFPKFFTNFQVSYPLESGVVSRIFKFFKLLTEIVNFYAKFWEIYLDFSKNQEFWFLEKYIKYWLENKDMNWTDKRKNYIAYINHFIPHAYM